MLAEDMLQSILQQMFKMTSLCMETGPQTFERTMPHRQQSAVSRTRSSVGQHRSPASGIHVAVHIPRCCS